MPDQTMPTVSALSPNDRPARFLCHKPWEQLLLNPNDYYGPCCDLAFLGKRPTSLDDVMELYNSQEMTSVRQALIDGSALQTVCRGCSIAGAGHYIPSGHEGFYRDRSARVSTPPAEIVAGVSSVCNLRCVMCDSHSGPLLKELGRDDLRLLAEIGFHRLKVVTITGGEPFVTPDSVELLRGLAERNTGHMKIRVITNAQVLGRHLDLISRLRNLHLTVSIDGTGEVYERVRPRAKWQRLLDNLSALKVLRDSRDDMILSINTVVMRSTLGCLSAMVDLAALLDARVDFQLIREGSCPDEEVLGTMPCEEVTTALDTALAAIQMRETDLGRHGADMHSNLVGLRAHVEWWWSERFGRTPSPKIDGARHRNSAPCAGHPAMTLGHNLIRHAELQDYATWWVNDILVSPPASAPHLAPIGEYRVVVAQLPPIVVEAGSCELSLTAAARNANHPGGSVLACDVHRDDGHLFVPAHAFRERDGEDQGGGLRLYRLRFAIPDERAVLRIRLWNFDNAELLIKSAVLA